MIFLAINDSSVTSTGTRNPKVSLFTKLRTKDEHGAMHCDMCDEFMSFDTRNFETHHIIPLSAGGIDNVYNTVCLCGNCHNRIHSKFPPTMYEMGKLLEKVRERIKSTTPYYLQKNLIDYLIQIIMHCMVMMIMIKESLYYEK
ncbi:MAG: HNH endonuclease [Clostridium sp.]|nr:MAG: HNH endonuclease [Clostridium sp.]